MAKAQPQRVLAEVDSKLEVLKSFSTKLHALLPELLNQENLQVQSITARVKSRESTERKIAKKEGRYRSWSDITDLVGLRVTAFFADDIDAICTLIASEFSVDGKNSVDKRSAIDPDRFGYMSVHFVVSLSPKRASLIEWKRFKGLKAEIQVRSVLQHAWAEIEHDLGYKAGSEIPRTLKRRFSILAGLLELADSEFGDLRKRVAEYEKEVKGNLKSRSVPVELDSTSIRVFADTSAVVAAVDKEIASTTGSIVDPVFTILDEVASELKRFGTRTTTQVEEKLREHMPRIMVLARKWSSDPDESTPRGRCLWYLLYMLAIERDGERGVLEFLARQRIEPEEDQSLQGIANDAIAAFRSGGTKK